MEEDEDKKKIYQQEQKWFLEWMKSVCEKSFEEVRDLAEQLVVEDKISSLHSLISEVCDGSGHKTIHFAVSRNQLETTQWILEIDPTCINDLDEDGYSPICHAVVGDMRDMVRFLVSRGGELNLPNSMLPINIAIDNNNRSMTKLLLELGADANFSTPKSCGHPIHHACAHNATEIVTILLSYNVDVNVKNEDGITPLIYAAVQTNPQVTQQLLDHGANPLVTLQQGETPLHILAECGHIPCIKPYLNHPLVHDIVNAKDNRGYKPVSYAAESSQLDVLELLLPLTDGCERMTVDEAMLQLVPDTSALEEDEAEGEREPAAPRVVSAADKAIVLRKNKEATALFKQEKYQEALDIFLIAVEIDPDNEILHSNISSCYLKLQQEEKAMEEADRCIALKPEWAKGFFRKGMVYFQQEKYIDAAETFYRGCELDPTDVRLSEMYKESIRIGKEQFQQHTLKE